MVRATIACARCRRSKIKCIHEGQSPCRNCLKSGRTGPEECILSGPFIAAGKATEKQSNQLAISRDNTQPVPRRPLHTLDDRASHPPCLSPVAVGEIEPHPGLPISHNTHEEIILGTPTPTIVQCVAIFSRKFPELAFLHHSNFFGSWKIHGRAKHGTHTAAMLALCSNFLPTTLPGLLLGEDYASYARDGLSHVVLEAPNTSTVQALLTMAMYEWGCGNGYMAWMYSGMATRMMQCLQTLKNDTARSEKEQEIQNRTFWSCFVMDRLIFCGRGQPLALPLQKMTIHLPIGEQDFAFGQSTAPRIRYKDLDVITAGSDTFDTVDNYYSVLIRGLDIWYRAFDFVVSDGRRRPGMAKPENCPWVESSPWRSIHDSLESWRAHQTCRLRYPSSDVATHVSLGHGEAFAFVNLIYYVSVLFLNREYIPFLPSPDSEPQGPVDPPLLEATAPQDWWRDRARDLFHAAACITNILQELEDHQCGLFTPFPGFCAFSAATMNLYVAAFPKMNLGRSQDAAALVQDNINYLENFRQIWKMGNGWRKALKHAQDLYQRINLDAQRFRGKTRADFTALEASIHDYSGVSPITEDIVEEPTPQPGDEAQAHPGHAHAATLCLQEHPNTTVIYQQQQSIDLVMIDQDIEQGILGTWNEIWPMWGDQEYVPFATFSGVDFDFGKDTNPA